MARPTALAIPEVSLGYFETGVPPTLTKRTGGDLNTLGDTVLGVTRGDGTDLSELLEVVHADLVAGQVEHDVLQSATGHVSGERMVHSKRRTHVRWTERIGHG